jgi:hypothetical protein
MSTDALLPASAERPSNAQRMFARYYTGFLMDLVVLNLFAEYTTHVAVDSFTTSLWAAALLQVLLKATIVVEHKVADYIKSKGTGGWWTFLRFFCAWLVLFGSKFVILEALTLAFGDKVKFIGLWHGIIWLIIVVVVMLIAEEIIVRIYRKLAEKPE